MRITTLDKYVLRSLVVNYVIAIGVMMSLYIMLDVFFNMDEFTESGGGAGRIMMDMYGFYGTRIFLYFSQLSGVITLFACMTTLARMRRSNELTAMMASGVSLYRVAAPVIVFGMFTSGLWWVDTEVLIPSVAHKLARRHDDARGLKTYGVWFLNDRDGALLCAQQYLPSERIIKRLLVLHRDRTGAVESLIEADRAEWVLDPESPSGGKWRLDRGVKRWRSVAHADGLDVGGVIKRQNIEFYESDLDPKAIEVRQSAGWIRYLSSSRLKELANQLEGRVLEQVTQAKHTRFATPLVNMLLLLLGLPFILDRQPGNILADAGRCLLACGLCFLLTFVGQSLSVPANLSALPAWIPVIVFTPFTVILLDRIRT